MRSSRLEREYYSGFNLDEINLLGQVSLLLACLILYSCHNDWEEHAKVHKYVHSYIRTYIQTYMYTHIYVHVYRHVYRHADRHIDRQTDINTYAPEQQIASPTLPPPRMLRYKGVIILSCSPQQSKWNLNCSNFIYFFIYIYLFMFSWFPHNREKFKSLLFIKIIRTLPHLQKWK